MGNRGDRKCRVVSFWVFLVFRGLVFFFAEEAGLKNIFIFQLFTLRYPFILVIQAYCGQVQKE